MLRFTTALGVCGAVAAAALSLPASAQVVNAVDRGYYDSDFHDPNVTNYFVGTFGTPIFNFLVFDIPALGINEVYDLATLSLYNPGNPPDVDDGYLSSSPTETYTLYDYTGSIANLIDGTGGVAAYNDLGGGTALGTVSVGNADNGKFVTFNLNNAGLAAVNAAAGGRIAFGGRLTDTNNSGLAYAFAFSDDDDMASTQLTLNATALRTSVPEPGEWAAMGVLAAGLGGLVLRKRLRR